MKEDEILVTYWKEDEDIINFGENISEVLIKEFGYKVRTHYDAVKKGDIDKYDCCLLIIGTWLYQEAIDMIKTKKLLVWGGGAGADWGTPIDMKSQHNLNKLDIRAVRGPYTLQSLNLDPSTPIGDPGFLLPLLFPIKKNKSQYKIIYQPHHANRNDINKKLNLIGAKKYLDIMISREQFWDRLKELVSAKFVLTNSLHTAIVSHAYGVPWALCLPMNDKLKSPNKWRDVFEFLGIYDDFKVVKNYKEGLEWWKKVGSKAKIPSLIPLIDSFPFPIKNERIHKIIRNYRTILNY